MTYVHRTCPRHCVLHHVEFKLVKAKYSCYVLMLSCMCFLQFCLGEGAVCVCVGEGGRGGHFELCTCAFKLYTCECNFVFFSSFCSSLFICCFLFYSGLLQLHCLQNVFYFLIRCFSFVSEQLLISKIRLSVATYC